MKHNQNIEVLDKSLSLFEIDDNGRALQVNKDFFTTYGSRSWHLRFCEKILYDYDTGKYIYRGSWKWAKGLRKSANYEHISVFTTDKEQLGIEQVLLYGNDNNGLQIASYDTCAGRSNGGISKSTLPWYDQQNVGFWIEDLSIESGAILAFINSAGVSAEKVHIRMDHSLISKAKDNMSAIYSNGVGLSC